jgi:hypothetical protein
MYQPIVNGGIWFKYKFFCDELADVPCEMCSEGDSASGSDRGQQRIVATDSKSDHSSDENAGSNTAGTAKKKSIKKKNHKNLNPDSKLQYYVFGLL